MDQEKHLSMLHPATLKVLEKSQDERIRFLYEDKWIGYPKAKEILSELNRLYNMPHKLRMPNLLLYGETNNGKSSIIDYFKKQHPNANGNAVEIIPIVSVMAPEGPDLNALYDAILYEIMVPFASTAKKSKKLHQIQYYFELINVKMLVIDEIHNILSGTVGKQSEFMNALKNLNNTLHIPIVLVGIKDALRATSTNSQIKNRFPPIYLPQWVYDSDEYLQLLASIEKLLPLKKPSQLANNDELSLEIYTRTNGYIGEIFTFITTVAEQAIISGKECITLKDLQNSPYERDDSLYS
jgi:hypothetical protein